VEGWLQVKGSEMKIGCQMNLVVVIVESFNLEMEYLGSELCYAWLKSVKEARCYKCCYE